MTGDAAASPVGTAPPVGTPWPEAGFVASLPRALRGWRTFRGRASRAEFWWWTLWCWLISAVLGVVGILLVLPDLIALVEVARSSMASGGGSTIAVGLQEVPDRGVTAGNALAIVSAVVGLVALLPTVAVSVRRLHDTNRTGWWTVLWFVPFLQVIAWVLLADRSNPVGARYDG